MAQFEPRGVPIAWRWAGAEKRIRCPAGAQPIDATEAQMREWCAAVGYDLRLTGCWDAVTDEPEVEA